MKPLFCSLLSNKTIMLCLFLLPLLLGCSKEHSIETGGVSNTSGTYEFSEGGTVYKGNIDSSYIVSGNSVNELHIIGHPAAGNDEFHLILYSPDSFGAGTYDAATFNSAFDYGSQPVLLYTAGQSIGVFSVTVTASDETLITGDFSGQALKEGTDMVNITDGNFRVVLPQKPAAPTSEGVLGNESGECQPVTVDGVYRQGTALNATNTVKIQANVTTPGTYSIFTDPVDGVVFSGQGTFSEEGAFTVTLTGSGTATTPGDKDFVVHFGNSTCSFSVTFLEEVAASNDYFPLTTGSSWTFSDGLGNFRYFKVTDQYTTSGDQSYKIIGEYSDPENNAYDNLAYQIRKDAGTYYNLMDYAALSGTTGQPQLLETVILKDNVPVGTSWDGPAFNLTSGPQTISAKIKFTITDTGVDQAVGGFDFQGIIKVKGEIVVGGISTGDFIEAWYVKNVGPVFFKAPDGTGFQIAAFQIF